MKGNIAEEGVCCICGNDNVIRREDYIVPLCPECYSLPTEEFLKKVEKVLGAGDE